MTKQATGAARSQSKTNECVISFNLSISAAKEHYFRNKISISEPLFYGSSGHGLFDQTKMIRRCFFKRFGRLEQSRKKRTLVWGVREMLRFKTKCFVLLEARVA